MALCKFNLNSDVYLQYMLKNELFKNLFLVLTKSLLIGPCFDNLRKWS